MVDTLTQKDLMMVGNDAVYTLGNEAFYKCNSLQKMELDHTCLDSIDESAFQGCSYMEEISIPSSLLNLGDGAFLDCKALTTVDLSNTKITEVGYHGHLWLRPVYFEPHSPPI